MRRWLLILVMLLLPLRGYMGDAMAGQMHEGAAGAHAHVAAPADAAPSGHGHGCDGHAGTPATQDAQPQADSDAPSCASCQVCSAVALSPAGSSDTASALTHPRPQTIQRAYLSADAGLSFKPPRH